MTGFMERYYKRYLSFTTNKIRIITLFLIAVLSLAATGLRSGKRKPLRSYVVVVSLDAFRWDYPDLYNTPNLDRLSKEGVKAERMISSFPTNTFPNHYTIATGLYPDHHGLINNSFHAPELDMFYRMGDRSAVENPVFYGGEPMWVTAEKQGVRAASFFWVGSEAPVGGVYPSYWKKYDGSTGYMERIDTVIKWLSYPPELRPELVTLYYDEPDATSHDFGPVSVETRETVEYLDSLIGVLRNRIASLPYGNRVNLIVLSDHGMAAVSPDRYVNLKSLIPDRMITSISGGNPVYLIGPAEGKADSVLYLINLAEGVKAWKKSELPARWNYGTHPRIPEIVVVADSSWSIGTRPSASSNKGAHGYDNYNPELFSIFYAAGPAFKKNYSFRELNNVDVYNLVCRIIRINPAPNDGNPKTIRKMLR
jgi:alkaline phosphatase D